LNGLVKDMGNGFRGLATEMAITYDEVWITTSREVKVCEDSIRSYKKELKSFEQRYGITTEEFINSGATCIINISDKDRKKMV